MPQIGNLGIRITWQFYVLDDAGNTHALPSEPLQLQEPSEAAFRAAWQRFEAEREQHRANLAAQMDVARDAAIPMNGKRHGKAVRPVEATAGAEE